MRLMLLVVALGLTAAAASAAPDKAPMVTCENIVVPTGSFTWRPERVVLGVVATPPRYLRQTVPTGEARWPFWSKAGIAVRADSGPISVSIAPAWRRRAAIGWGNVDAAATLTFVSCPPSSSLGEWNPYSGGFVLRSRAVCVPLTFRVGSDSATVRFGVGKRCR